MNALLTETAALGLAEKKKASSSSSSPASDPVPLSPLSIPGDPQASELVDSLEAINKAAAAAQKLLSDLGMRGGTNKAQAAERSTIMNAFWGKLQTNTTTALRQAKALAHDRPEPIPIGECKTHAVRFILREGCPKCDTP